MKHFSELPTATVRQIFHHTWYITEKYDGSFIRAGLDELGRFYTSRKGLKERYYSVDDWAPLAWTNTFRQAHVAAEAFFDYLKEDEFLTTPCPWIDFEVIGGVQPNAITYNSGQSNSLIAIDASFDLNGTKRKVLIETSIFAKNGHTRHFEDVDLTIDQLVSYDGSSSEWQRVETYWDVTQALKIPYDPYCLRDEKSPVDIIACFNSYTSFWGYPVTLETVLNCKLNKKPDFVKEEVWKNKRAQVVEALRDLRETTRAAYEKRCNVLARVMKYQLSRSKFSNFSWRRKSTSQCEGVVVRVNTGSEEIVFKLVDKEQFAPLNEFAHIVRYWLQGGRRPARPSFMSRTQTWPVEKRLARLEVLRKRYIEKRKQLKIDNRFNQTNYGECVELDQRTLLLFAELKERITNGWSSIQKQDSTNPETGNPADD